MIITAEVGAGGAQDTSGSSSTVRLPNITITAEGGQRGGDSGGKGGYGYSGGGGGIHGGVETTFTGFNGGSNGGNGEGSGHAQGGSGSGENIDDYYLKNFKLSPGRGGQYYRYRDFMWNTGALIMYGGGGGGVLVDNNGPPLLPGEVRPADLYNGKGKGYGGGGGGGHFEGVNGVILVEVV